MKISLLTPDLSHNCLGRAYLLAQILKRHYEVEIIGPVFGEGIWRAVAEDNNITYKYIKINGWVKPYFQIKKLIKMIDGDIIYASKPVFTSFGIGLYKKFKDNKPLILDIDDWEMGLIKETYKNPFMLPRLKSLLVSGLVPPYHMGSYWNRLINEKLIGYADDITVSNTFLKQKFGGKIVWHARDIKTFDPLKFDKNSLKDKYKMGDKNIVIFFGTPRPHKSLDDLIESIKLIQNNSVLLTIVGIDYKDKYCMELIELAKAKLGEERFRDFGLQPFEKVPEFLAMADIVVIPQKRNFATIGQIPAKLFDAMAMAKPIIATNVSDLPEILDGCGLIVEPEKPNQLAKAIQYVLDNPIVAEKMGINAREKCIKKYSLDAMENVLVNIISKYR